MFHVTDNLYFGRMPNGDVRILKFKEPPKDWPLVYGDYEGLETDLTVKSNHWASVVASVSVRGESNGRYYEASDFHNK